MGHIIKKNGFGELNTLRTYGRQDMQGKRPSAFNYFVENDVRKEANAMVKNEIQEFLGSCENSTGVEEN